MKKLNLIPWKPKEIKGFASKETKDGEAVVTFDTKRRFVQLRFHNTIGGGNIPFDCVKNWYKKICKMEEFGIVDEYEIL